MGWRRRAVAAAALAALADPAAAQAPDVRPPVLAPLLTISGTARLSGMGVPQFFRFFPSDATVKVEHARCAAEKLDAKWPAVIYQSTAYGQSGREQLARTFAELRISPVLEESVAPTVNDLTPALLQAKAANADVIGGLLREGTSVTPMNVRERLGTARWQGVTHEAEIVCFDSADHIPRPIARYSFP